MGSLVWVMLGLLVFFGAAVWTSDATDKHRAAWKKAHGDRELPPLYLYLARQDLRTARGWLIVTWGTMLGGALMVLKGVVNA